MFVLLALELGSTEVVKILWFYDKLLEHKNADTLRYYKYF